MPQIKSLKKITLILMLVMALFLPSVRADASSVPTFHKDYGRPEVSDTSGYVEIYWKTSNTSGCDVYYWSIVPTKGSDTSQLSSSYMGLRIGNSSGKYDINFSASVSNAQLGQFTLVAIYSKPQILTTTSFTTNTQYRVDYSDSYKIVGWHVYGNYGAITDNVTNNNFTVSYGSDTQYLELVEISDTLRLINNNLGGKLDSVIHYLDYILNNVYDIESALDSLKTYLQTELPNIASLIGITNDKLDLTNLKLDNVKTVLDNIYNIFIQMYSKNPSDTHKGEEFEENSNAQADQLAQNNNKLDSVEKPKPSQLDSQTIGKLDLNSIGVFGATLSPFMSNSFMLKMLVTSVILCIVGYIFFGKRG